MFRSLKVVFLASALVLVAGAMGTSALTGVTIDRDVAATLQADDSTNAALSFACVNNSPAGPDYSSVCSKDGNGIISLALDKGLKSSGGIGFNRNATFTLGSQTYQVLGITNNSGYAVKVYFDSTTGITMKSAAGISLTSATAGSPVGDTVAAGATNKFFFVVTTPNSNAASLTGTVQVRLP